MQGLWSCWRGLLKLVVLKRAAGEGDGGVAQISHLLSRQHTQKMRHLQAIVEKCLIFVSLLIKFRWPIGLRLPAVNAGLAILHSYRFSDWLCYKQVDPRPQRFRAPTRANLTPPRAPHARTASIERIPRQVIISLEECPRHGNHSPEQVSVGRCHLPLTWSAKLIRTHALR